MIIIGEKVGIRRWLAIIIGFLGVYLVMNPDFILLDEPFAGVDPLAVEDIKKIVINLKDRGIGVLITDHNVRETLSITDRAYLLFEGSILKSGSAKELIEDKEARRLYLGSKFKMDITD